MKKGEKQILEAELKETRERLQYLLAVSPGLIYTTQVSGDYACTFVSENLHEIVGYSPEEMTTDPKFWGTHIHPEDAPRVLKDVFPLIEKGGGTLEYRFQHREGPYLWFQDTFKVIHDEAGRPSEIVGSWADINERKRAEAALRESEEHYRAVIENVADAIVINVGTNRVFVNKAFLKLHGLDDVSQAIGTPLDQFIVPEDMQLVSERTIARQRGQSVPGVYEYRIRRADGEVRTVQTSAASITYEGQPAVLAVLRDTTDRKQAEEALRQAEDKYRSIFEHAAEGIFQTTPEGRYLSANPALALIYGYESPEELTQNLTDIGPQLYVEPTRRAEFIRLMQEQGTVTGLESQVYRKDGSVIWISESARAVRDESGMLLFYEGTVEDINERKAIETELKEARERLRYLLGVSPAIIYTTQASGDYACTFVSENLRAILGYAPEEMLTDPKFWPGRIHPEDAPRVFNNVLPLIEKGGGTVEYRFQHREGHYVWFQDTFKVIRDEAGRPLELVGAWADINERKQAAQAGLAANLELQETRRYLTRLIESSTDPVMSTDKEGNVVLFNEGAEFLLGYRAEEIMGRRVTELYESEERAKEVMREMRKRGGAVSAFETVLRAKDGSTIPVLTSASILFDEQGQEVGTVGFNTDLRDRKRAEDALRKAHDELEKRVEERSTEAKEARERLQYLLTVTPGIIYTNQASGDYRCTFVSQNVDPIMGFSTWEMLEDPEFWSKRLHPDDAQRVFNDMFPLMEQGGGTVEYRFRHRRGHYVWIQDTFTVMRDAAGNPVEIVGSWADISDRKKVEQALGERWAAMQDLETLVAASPSVIYTNQASGDFACTFVSENLDSIMGYAPWEMRDDPKFWVKRLHPEDASRVFAEIDKLIGQGGGTVEYRFRHRRGHYVWIQDTFKVMRDEKSGEPKELVGSWADINDRKGVEAELQILAEQVELRNRFIRETFGRYLTDDVVTSLLDSPTGLELGGEKRKITMMMTDLRGFTSLSERLAPERVVALLNRYLATMVTIIKQYEGTIDEFIGDAIFVLFGAPVWQEDDAQRAVACAVTMQLAMAEVNAQNRQDGLPEVEMGIGVHTGSVVVGNIGSAERMKYGVVGSHVNLTSRIQSFTTGGQILISEPTRKEVEAILKVGKQMEIKAKGFEKPVPLSEVRGIGGKYKVLLPEIKDALVALPREIPLRYTVVEGDHLSGVMFEGSFVKLSAKGAEARLENPVAPLTNLNMHLIDGKGEEIPGTLYGKVVEKLSESSTVFSVRFTSIPPEVETFLDRLLAQSSP